MSNWRTSVEGVPKHSSNEFSLSRICSEYKEVNITARVNKDMIIADIIALDQGTIPILLNAGMHCVGCPSAQGESIEEAAMVHGLDADALVDDINDYLETK